jgi:hypothetical protein
MEQTKKHDHTALIFRTKQANHNPLVGGSNPPAATIFSMGYVALAGSEFRR